MTATWQMIPEELITKIGDVADFGTKLNLRACSTREHFALTKSKMDLKKVKITMQRTQMEVGIEEENGKKWKIGPVLRRTPHPYESRYYELLEHLEFAISWTSGDVSNFQLIGEAYQYPEIFCFPQLVAAKNVELACSEERVMCREWMPCFPQIDRLHYELRGNTSQPMMEDRPFIENIKHLSIAGFDLVDLKDFFHCRQLETITITGEDLRFESFIKNWSNPIKNNSNPLLPVPDTFRNLYFTGENSDYAHRKYFLGNIIRESEEPEEPGIQKFLICRKRDGAVANLDFGDNWVKFEYTPFKYEPQWNWYGGVEDRDMGRLLGRKVELRLRASNAASLPGFWH